MTILITKCVILSVILTQTSSYTFVTPKIFGQSLTPSSRAWSNIVPYPPFRTYQPSIPLQYLRYYRDPYYASNLQNPDYYFGHDSYDDGDFYSNIYYYLPGGRRGPFYEQTVMDPVEEMPDYDDEPAEEGDVTKSQRDWWLEKNVGPNEDTDFRQPNRVDDLYNAKNIVGKTGPKAISKSFQKNLSKTRYGGIDGFGRKKEQEQVYGNYRPSARKEERPWVYGKPVHYERDEDTDVRDLKSLLADTSTRDDKKPVDFSLSNWASGNDKRSGGKASMSETKEKSKPANAFLIYDEGGKEFVPQKEYVPEQQPSVFDTIKTLLALEDRVNEVSSQDMKTHKLLKRKPPAYKPSTQMKNKQNNKDRSRTQSSSTENTPSAGKASPGESLETATNLPTRTNKRSVSSEENKESQTHHSSEDSLVRELSAVKQRDS